MARRFRARRDDSRPLQPRLLLLVLASPLWPQAKPAAPGYPTDDGRTPARADAEEGERRLKLARTMLDAGQHAEALTELLWCFDRGHIKNRAFWGQRLGPVLDALGELAALYPPARDEIVTRRQRRESALLALAPGAPPDNNDIAELLALNDALAESARSVTTYDQMAARHPRADLAFFYAGIRAELWKAKRYRTLVDGRPDASARLTTAAVALREASRRLVGQHLRPEPAFTVRIVAEVCIDVEARLALGETDAAAKLADAVVEFAPSLHTHARLIAHCERAGGEGLATRLERSALDGVEPEIKDAWPQLLAEARVELQARLGNKLR